jgi:hypothetical protein
MGQNSDLQGRTVACVGAGSILGRCPGAYAPWLLTGVPLALGNWGS